MHKCVQEAIFSTDNLVDYINAIDAPNAKTMDSGFTHIVNSMSASKMQHNSFNGILLPPSRLIIDILERDPVKLSISIKITIFSVI
jgi:hypothetical protein